MLESKASISFLPLSCVFMQIVLPLLQWSRSPLNPVKQWQPTVNIQNPQRRPHEWHFVNHVREMLPAFIIKGAIKVIAAGVEAGGELYKVASPRVASSGETGKSHQLLGTSGKEVPIHAAVIWQKNKEQAILLICCAVINAGMICDSAAKHGVKDSNQWWCTISDKLLNTIRL